LLEEIDQLEDSAKVLVIGTTNKLGELDKSLRRGGRLDFEIQLDMPSSNDRYLIFKSHLDTFKI